MARRPSHSPQQLAAALMFYVDPIGQPSVLAVARRFGIPETTLRREIRRRGILQAAVAAKGRQVAGHFREQHLANDTADDHALLQDVDDMSECLDVARRCVRMLRGMVGEAKSPRDVKAITEGAGVAMEIIRKVRGLDVPLDLEALTDEQLERLAKGRPL